MPYDEDCNIIYCDYYDDSFNVDSNCTAGWQHRDECIKNDNKDEKE